jgi:HTH-type transcriptional regulator / antitoxin HipB
MLDSKQIGKVVRSHRKKSGLTQKELSKLAGVGKTAVYDIEKGKPSIRFNTLLKVFGILNIKLELQSPIMSDLIDEEPVE